MSPRVSSFRALALALAGANVPIHAAAQPTPAPGVTPTLAWIAPPGCPTAADVQARLAEIVGADAAGAVDARAEVTPDPAGVRLVVRVGSGPTERRRELLASTCSLGADAAALFLAMSLAPRPAPSADPTAPTTASASAPLPENAPENAPGNANASPYPVFSSSPESPAPSSPRGRPVISLSPFFTVDAGPLPSPTASLGAAVTVRPHPLLRIELDGAYGFSRTSTLASGPGGTFSLATLGTRACLPVGGPRFEVAPCVGVAVDGVSGRGVAVASPKQADAWWWAPELGVTARLRLAGPISAPPRAPGQRPHRTPPLRHRRSRRGRPGLMDCLPRRARAGGAVLSTDFRASGQCPSVTGEILGFRAPGVERAPESVRDRARPAPLDFDAVYDANVDFVWRSARRLGIPDGSLEDVAQDAFVVVHRRLADYDGRAPLTSWLFGIVARVVRDHRRRFRRKGAPCVLYDDAVQAHGGPSRGTPQADAERSESARLLHALLDELDDGKREVLVLAQLEEMTIPEIAECLGLNVNTASARLRAARRTFEEAHARHRARAETARVAAQARDQGRAAARDHARDGRGK